MNISNLIFLVCFSYFNCTKCDTFYDENKNNTNSFTRFKSLIIEPQRSLLKIQLLDYKDVVFYIRENESDKEIKFYKSERAFNNLILNYQFSKSEAESIITNIYYDFKKLKIIALYGGLDSYITFIISNDEAIVYIPSGNKSVKEIKRQIDSIIDKDSKRFDENWICYKLEKPYIYN